MQAQQVVQQADAVHQQINSITCLLEQFNARRSGLLREASKRNIDCDCDTSAPAFSTSESSFLRPTAAHSRIPAEVLELIFIYLDSNDLVRLSKSNKSLNDIANRVLYHTISISSDLARSGSCMKTLVKHRKLSSLVRVFSIRWSNIYYPTKNLFDLVHRTLHSLPLITSLFIDIPGEFPQWNLQDCEFKLRSLNISFRFDNELVRFLESQPFITDLSLRGFNSDPAQFSFSATTFNLNPTERIPSLKPSALPRLAKVNAIHAGPDIMGAVVKNRPVKTLVVPLYADCALKCLDALLATSTPVEKLSIMSFDPNAPSYILQAISERFPDLEALAIVLLLAVCPEDALEGAAQYMSRFKRLQYITFMSASELPRANDGSLENEGRIARSWHAHCPSLKTIILPMGHVWYCENSNLTVLTENSV